MNLEQELYRYFGYRSFRSGQREVIESVLSGRDTLAMLSTGTGKSLCYQLPTKILGKPTVIVSPLISLMQDQVEQLKLNGEKRVVALNSFLTAFEKTEVIRHIKSYQFIFLSPEMLKMKTVMAALQTLNIGLFVIDEAHCISQWGYDFRPDYLNLGSVRKQLNDPVTLALTATATEQVREDIKFFLQLESCKEIITSVNRSNIGLFIEKMSSYEEKESRLVELVQSLQKPGIIYFLSKKAAETTSEMLRKKGVHGVSVYHAGMDQEQRILIQQQFLQNQLNVVCATSAFGMGINKDNVRFIIHFHLPPNMEAYLQEIGRAGRDGEPSVAILLYCDGDESLPLFLLENELPTERQIRDVFHEMEEYETQHSVISPSFVHESCQKSGFAETQERLLQYYIQQEGSLNDKRDGLIEHLKQAISRKQVKWSQFFYWVTQPHCYRNGILSYFEERERTHQKPCCSNCGDDLDLYEEQDMPETIVEMKRFDWKDELQAFLQPNRAVQNEK